MAHIIENFAPSCVLKSAMDVLCGELGFSSYTYELSMIEDGYLMKIFFDGDKLQVDYYDATLDGIVAIVVESSTDDEFMGSDSIDDEMVFPPPHCNIAAAAA